MNPTAKIIELYSTGHLSSLLPGLIRYFHLRRLRRRYGFDSWHVSPKELRPYALDLIHYVNEHVKDDSIVVEIGCGLGDIIRSIKSTALYGYDIDARVLEAARSLDRTKRVSYVLGSFDQLSDLDIEYLIAVNFTHNIPTRELKIQIGDTCNRNSVRHLIIDRVDDDSYAYHHGPEVIPVGYLEVYSTGNYTFDRRIHVYARDKLV